MGGRWGRRLPIVHAHRLTTGLWTSQKALSWLSRIFLSVLSFFLSILQMSSVSVRNTARRSVRPLNQDVRIRSGGGKPGDYNVRVPISFQQYGRPCAQRFGTACAPACVIVICKKIEKNTKIKSSWQKNRVLCDDRHLQNRWSQTRKQFSKRCCMQLAESPCPTFWFAGTRTSSYIYIYNITV